MPNTPIPLRTQTAWLVKGGMRNKAGSLLLYPDQLVHVGSKLAQIGCGFGALGVLVTAAVANARAAKRVAAGDRSVLCIPLGSISEVRGEMGKLRGQSLVVRTTAGDEFRFGGVKFDKWSDDLRTSLGNLGRTMSPSGKGFCVRAGL